MKRDTGMRGLILSGGTGSRLRPFTLSQPKQLLPLANKPVLYYAVEALVQAGIRDIGVVTGATGEQIRSALGDGERFGAALTYIPQAAPLGLADAVQTAAPFLGDSRFAVYLGDNFLKGGIAEHVAAFRASGADAQLLLKHVPNPHEFGVAVLDDQGRATRLIEKPAEPPSDLAILGVYLLGPRFFASAGEIVPSARGELEITDALQHLIDSQADVRASVVDGTWIDTGGPQDLLRANRLVLEDLTGCSEGARLERSQVGGNVVVGAGSRIVDSVIEGPSIIGRDVRIAGSYVGPGTSIHDGCRLEGVRVEGSILLERAVVEHLGGCLRDSIIGRDTRLTGSGRGESDLCFMLSDHSQVLLT